MVVSSADAPKWVTKTNCKGATVEALKTSLSTHEKNEDLCQGFCKD